MIDHNLRVHIFVIIHGRRGHSFLGSARVVTLVTWSEDGPRDAVWAFGVFYHWVGLGGQAGRGKREEMRRGRGQEAKEEDERGEA